MKGKSLFESEEELNEAWDAYFSVLAHSLKIDVFVEWLNKKLIRFENWRKHL